MGDSRKKKTAGDGFACLTGECLGVKERETGGGEK